jgi:hypothetical protein
MVARMVIDAITRAWSPNIVWLLSPGRAGLQRALRPGDTHRAFGPSVSIR